MSDITVLISSSPIKSHPSTAIIEETIRSVRFHLPTAPIFIMQDGVRPEQADRAEDYALYMRSLRLLNLPNVTIFDAPRFMHQATLTRWVLKSVESPMILFVEHDTPLVDGPDRPTFIDWPMLKNALMTEQTNHIRLHYDAEIHPDHQHMMRGHLTPNLIRCVQWHQRPHLARTRWYSDLLARIFTAESVTFIEDKVYSPVSYSDWDEFKVTIYDPAGTGRDMKRSRDLDGRAGEPKYSMIF